MPRTDLPQIMTANDLLEGDALFLGRIGWVRDIAAARVARTAEEAEMLETVAARAVSENLVVGPYLVAVEEGEAGPVPVLRRERIRAARGPSFALPAPGRVARAA